MAELPRYNVHNGVGSMAVAQFLYLRDHLASKMPSSLPSPRRIIKHASVALAQVIFGPGSQQRVLAGSSVSCPNAQLSCHNTTAANTCCLNAPGGQLLQTQFWDTSPPTGPEDSWTIHGLWPDLCNGSYEASCDNSRAYTNITQILQSFDRADLLDYMGIYWKDYQGHDESFWEHEWGKHGTCVSTLDPECYPDYIPTQEVVDYFNKTTSLFRGLDTYQTLADAGIIPSNSTTYTSADIEAAISSVFGYQVTIGCQSGALNEVWYHYNVVGSVQSGRFIPTDPDGSKSTCPTTGVSYLPKVVSTAPSPSSQTESSAASTAPTSSSTTSSEPGILVSGNGYLNVQSSGSSIGCIISNGKWFTSGTCATFRVAPSNNQFTISSSQGPCGFVAGAFTCGSSTPTTSFSAEGSILVASEVGNTFYSDNVPSGRTQATVYSQEHSTSLQIVWQGV